VLRTSARRSPNSTMSAIPFTPPMECLLLFHPGDGALLIQFPENGVAGSLGSLLPESRAVSTGRCNAGLEFTSCSFKAQSFPWALIELQRYFVEVGLGIAEQVGFLGEVLS
jgi:hypothetical protein